MPQVDTMQEHMTFGPYISAFCQYKVRAYIPYTSDI